MCFYGHSRSHQIGILGSAQLSKGVLVSLLFRDFYRGFFCICFFLGVGTFFCGVCVCVEGNALTPSSSGLRDQERRVLLVDHKG